MMTPMTRQRTKLAPGDPRLIATYRFQFYAYLVRHTFGIFIFPGMSALSFHLGAPPMGWLFLVLSLAYGGLVAVNIRKLYLAWKKNEAVHRQKEAYAASQLTED